MEKKKVSVFVAGQRFNIITEEEEKYVRELASHVDAKITSLSISGDMTRESAAVLTALDLADDGEHQKREINAIKEQVKDYLSRIETLSAENDRLNTELSKAQLSVTALDDARATLAASDREKEALKKQIFALKEQIELMQSVGYRTAEATEEAPQPAAEDSAAEESAPIPTEADAPEEKSAPDPQPAISAEDDLFFDLPEEEPVKPSRKEKKNRHEHKHMNPYKQQYLQQQEQKGYTQQRQYSLFDDTDE